MGKRFHGIGQIRESKNTVQECQIVMEVLFDCSLKIWISFSEDSNFFKNDESLESGRVRFGACLKIYLLVLLKAAMLPMSGRV